MLRRGLLSCLAVVLLLHCGCKPTAEGVVGAVAVRGKVTQGGQPLVVAGREIGTGQVSVIFIPMDAGTGQTFAATADAAGDFDLPGGMPAGKYRIAVRQWEPYPTTDKLGGKYDEQNTPLERTIDGKTAVVIELE